MIGGSDGSVYMATLSLVDGAFNAGPSGRSARPGDRQDGWRFSSSVTLISTLASLCKLGGDYGALAGSRNVPRCFRGRGQEHFGRRAFRGELPLALGLGLRGAGSVRRRDRSRLREGSIGEALDHLYSLAVLCCGLRLCTYQRGLPRRDTPVDRTLAVCHEGPRRLIPMMTRLGHVYALSGRRSRARVSSASARGHGVHDIHALPFLT